MVKAGSVFLHEWTGVMGVILKPGAAHMGRDAHLALWTSGAQMGRQVWIEHRFFDGHCKVVEPKQFCKIVASAE